MTSVIEDKIETSQQNDNSNRKNNNSVSISVSDIEARNKRIQSEMVERDQVATTNKIQNITLAREWAYNLEMLVDNRLVPWGKETIFSTIHMNLRRQGMSAYGLQNVYEAFRSPEYDKYKFQKALDIVNKRAQTWTNQTIEEINKLLAEEEAAYNSQINDAFLTIETHFKNPSVQDKMQKYFNQYEKEQKKAKQQVKDLDKICMEHPEPQISNFYDALKYMVKVGEETIDRVFNYPPLNFGDDHYYTRGVMLYTKWLKSIADLKNSRSNYSWIDIIIEQYNQSTHSAMSKSKIEALFRDKSYRHLKGTMRKVTREQIDAKAPIIIDLAREIVELAPLIIGVEFGGLIRDVFKELIEEEHPLILIIASRVIENTEILLGPDLYKDLCQAGWNAGFHVRRHDKLSESAFGNSTLAN